jgi:GntR family transcriptional regulator/MocR family aminotransferase
MTKLAGGTILPNLVTDMQEGPLRQQVYRRIREGILQGRIAAGTRLPSTRTLATDIGVSRNTTEEAYAQLEAEGFLSRKVGSGTYVSSVFPEFLPVKAKHVRASAAQVGVKDLSERGRLIAASSACSEPTAVTPFVAGAPDYDAFPHEIWNRILIRRARESGTALLQYGEAAGLRELREAVAGYVATSRGVLCEPRQVVILTSSQQALDLCARLLIDPGDEVWMEEPGYPGAAAALQSAGAKLALVPVDDAGLNVERGIARAPRAKLAYVTPSHQYPLGVTMQLERRLALLEWARSSGGWILEDDYDSEFRYAGNPHAAIQGLREGSRVLYIGTFTKVMFPSLRIAYLIVPDGLADAFANARAQVDGHTPSLTQAALADFITEGHFGAHLRRMRSLYRGRRDVLVDSLQRYCGDAITLGDSDCGLHVTAFFRPGTDDRAVSRRARELGIEVQPLSRFYLGGHARPGGVLGYSALQRSAIVEGARKLARALASVDG